MSHRSDRVLSGIRTTGQIHLGHYHGVIKNWLKLQNKYDCFFFAADWHALTTNYANPREISQQAMELIITFLASGIDPNLATIFIQSQVPEHAELHLLLSMLTPLPWLERIPTYKDQQIKLQDKDLTTYGFLGYPVLQSSDVLLYQSKFVPVGADQVSHIELVKQMARRFNYLYGSGDDFKELIAAIMNKLDSKTARQISDLSNKYSEQGKQQYLDKGYKLISEVNTLTSEEKENLVNYLKGIGKRILLEPQALLTETSKLPGTDGQKMSKSYGNFILLGAAEEKITLQIKRMTTDPARVRRNDPGEPTKCPVWELHCIYSKQDVINWVEKGCRGAQIGCLECKQPLIEAIIKEQEPIRQKKAELEKETLYVTKILKEGTAKARDAAQATLTEVRKTMGLNYL